MLYVVATPIGNLGDISSRAIEVLKSVTVIACEDTRRTWQLLSSLDIPRPEMISYREGNEEFAGNRIIGLLKSGVDVALCSDGGYPAISDPGFRLVRSAVAEGLEFTVIPGASAVNISLIMSGLPTSSWTFKGFPPRKPGALHRFFADEAELPHTMILFESPFRVSPTLKAALEALGDRNAAVCMELTKLHERIERGPLSSLIEKFEGVKIKGEVSIVIEGKRREKRSQNDE
jgi:16S rRNA (cytidine1402-2'-O)-methyltransferase